MNDSDLEAKGHAERLTILIDEEKIKNPRQLALSIEMDPSQLTKVMRAESTLPYAQAKKISVKYGYSIDWLMVGEGEKKMRTNIPRGNNQEEQKELSPSEWLRALHRIIDFAENSVAEIKAAKNETIEVLKEERNKGDTRKAI